MFTIKNLIEQAYESARSDHGEVWDFLNEKERAERTYKKLNYSDKSKIYLDYFSKNEDYFIQYTRLYTDKILSGLFDDYGKGALIDDLEYNFAVCTVEIVCFLENGFMHEKD